MFGSFAEEKEKVVYGIYDHPKSWNPVRINFHFFIVLWRYATATPKLWDKVRVWFMPAGWRPPGVGPKEMIEITTENQVKFRPTMFDNSRMYLIIQLVVGVFLMMGVISNLLSWNTAERWIGATLLWWHIINWSGILEAKPWLWISENLRIVAAAFAIIAFNELYQPSVFLFAVIAVSAFSFVWTNLYFRPASPKLLPA